jgi:hypothetical protein
LAEVGVESTEAGCDICLFSDINAADVTSAIIKPEFKPGFCQERRQPVVERGVDQQGDPALGNRPDFANGQRDLIRRQRDGFAVEIAAGNDRAIREHQRVIGHGVCFDHERVRHGPQDIEARAADLRLAPDAIRILHPHIVHAVAFADNRPRQQQAQRRGGVNLSLVPTQPVNLRPEGDRRTHGCIGGKGSRNQRGLRGPMRAKQARQRERR